MRLARQVAWASISFTAALASACHLDDRALVVQDSGTAGAAGTTGAAGATGAAGTTGVAGTTGTTGTTGAAGTVGAAGTAGTTSAVAPGPPLSVTTTSTGTFVSTLAGSGEAAFADGTGAAASFSSPGGVAVDTSGNLYVADSGNNRIRKVTSAGVVTTFAGSGEAAFVDGTGAAASFNGPFGIALDSSGNLYVADNGNNRIRQVTPAGVVTTLVGSGEAAFADGTGTAASFNGPTGVAVDAAGNIYVGDDGNERLRKVTPAGVVTTIAGSGASSFADGTGTAAGFDNVWGVAVDAGGNIYVGDGNRVRKVTPTGVVTTLAGSDSVGCADFCAPTGVAVDPAGNVYIGYFGQGIPADRTEGTLRRVTPAGVATTLAGWVHTSGFADGVGPEARFLDSFGLSVDAAGNVYVGDTGNNRIRKVSPVGLGQLAVAWNPPITDGGSPITSYTASARATGQPTLTCATTNSTSCVISGLTSGFAYKVTVTATNAVGTSVPSADVGDGLGIDGRSITKVVPTGGCGGDPGQYPGTPVHYTIATMGTKDPDCADQMNAGAGTNVCGPWMYTREYYVTLPVGYDNTKAYPLVIEAPGCGGNGTNLYPLAVDNDVNKLNVDNTVIHVGLSPPPLSVGHATNPGQGCFDDAEGDDSVEWPFYEGLYDQLAKQVCFDRNRVFAAGNARGGMLATELGYKYAGNPARPIRGVLSNGGGLTLPKYQPTFTANPTAGIWIDQTGAPNHPFTLSEAAIARAMSVNKCTIGSGYADAQFDSFPIGGGNPDTTCTKIKGCPDYYPLVVCAIPGYQDAQNANVANPGFSTFIKLFETPPLFQ